MKYTRLQKRKNPKKGLNIKKQKRKYFRIAPFVTAFLAILIFSLGIFLVFSKYRIFDIRNVQVSGTKSFVNEIDLLELTKSRSYGQNLLTLSSKNLKNSLLDSFQGAKDMIVRKKLPSTIEVIVVERVPLALVSTDNSELFYLIDEDGYVLGQVEKGTTNFPKVQYLGDVKVGYFLDQQVTSIYFELLKAFDTEKIMASSMSVHSDYVSMFLEKNIEVFVGRDKEISSTIAMLSALLKQLAAEGRAVKRIDLRYDKVIVSYR